VITENREIEFDPDHESLEFRGNYWTHFMVGVVAYPPNRKPIFYKMNTVWIGSDFGKGGDEVQVGISVSIWMAIVFFLIVFVLAFLVYQLRMRVKETERKLEYEMNDVRNLASVASFSPERTELNRDRRTNGIIED
jgi:hypothetical protein